jgi:hypothetical protein
MEAVYQDRRVIAVVRYKNEWCYYCCDEDIWVMDRGAWRDLFTRHGYEEQPLDPDWRCGIVVVDDVSAEDFLKCISGCLVNEDALRGALREQFHLGWDAVAHIFPSIMLDFDKKNLSSVYDGGLEYERYVPNGWQGRFENFFDSIPQDRRYWLDGERNYLQLLIDLYRSGVR